MKGLLILLTVLAVVWLLRGSRRVPPPARRDEPPAPAPGRALQTMRRCAHCGMHLAPTPSDSDTDLPAKPAYCSVAHRLAGPRAPFGKR